MGALTTKNRPNGESYKQLAIVLDDQLHSAPRIESPIHRNGQITGSFTEARNHRPVRQPEQRQDRSRPE